MLNKIFYFFIIIIFCNFCNKTNAQVLDDFVLIKGGKFKMGSNEANDQKPVRKVKISDFYILDHEVTNAEYAEFLNQKGNYICLHYIWIQLHGTWRNEKCRIYESDSVFYVEKGYEKHPITFVSWWGAQAYAEWKGGRLPTEAEWEYIAFETLNEIPADSLLHYEVFIENSNNIIAETKSKKKLPNGIYDFFGNLSEWCYDWYFPVYSKKQKTNPQGPESGDQKVKRGYYWGDSYKDVCKSYRKASNPNNNNITVGFRVVIPVSGQNGK